MFEFIDISNIPFRGNYIDLIIIIIVFLYVVEGLERGFWVLLGDLVSFITSISLALRFYSAVSNFLGVVFDISPAIGNALGFVLVATFPQTILSSLVRWLLGFIPQGWRENWWSRGLSVVPAIADASIFIAALLTLFVSIPLSSKLKADVINSKIGGFLVLNTTQLERMLTDVFGGAVQGTLTFLTVQPGAGQKIDISYRPQKLSIDQDSEIKMLELVNKEREKFGIKPLVMDEQLREVARKHSKDMWERGYFAHINPDGKTPFDRMSEAGIKFMIAGENLALSPTVELAHQGLMNSEGHRRNILDPSFSRISIGVVDGGIYGKMFTQNFAD